LLGILKVIDEFTYDHSERLGDAFEYLLSVLGSQGDAGQFRTPRHIIDFIVEIVDPKKEDTILDPACGTAGFLISAYKHVLRANKDEQCQSTLTPDERSRLAQNIKGYDISPDMVRLSLVNLYLHRFFKPQIDEYDTLTSEDKWNERFDVILANPPFMSPKGGIRPHRRFSIQSKRSEVLFVDYIAEHLTTNGRAGIIVPEGIIFQSQTSYKQLRKMLVDESLVAVVSLPSGIFQPYSGVKTSILILDKALAKKSGSVAFFKIENDGFGLGAQRRAIEKNDLPQAKSDLAKYFQRVRAGESLEDFQPPLGLIVEKANISANGDYNLSGERYRQGDQRISKYPHVELGEVVDILDSRRRPITKGDRKPGPYPYYGATGVLDYVEDFLFDEPLVLVGEDGAKWGAGEKSAFPVEGKVWVNNHAHVLRPKREMLMDRFLIEILNEADLLPYITGVTVPKLNQEKLRSIKIPLPPLEVQQEIVAEIESYQKVINGARTVLDHYRPHIPIHPEWPVFELSEVTTKITDGAHFTPTYVESGVPFLRVTDITESNTSKKFIPQEEHDELIKRCRPEKGDVLYSKNGTIGIAKLVDWDWEFSIFVSLCLIKPKKDLLDSHYLQCFLNSDAAYAQATARSKSGTVTNLHLVDIKTIKIPLPPLATQQAIVAEIEAEQALVAANRELIERFEKKIQSTLARIWGEETPISVEE
jgi:type I restriction enzyme M protein